MVCCANTVSVKLHHREGKAIHPTHRNMQFLIKNILSFSTSLKFLPEHLDLNSFKAQQIVDYRIVHYQPPMFLKKCIIQICPGLPGRISAVLLQNICKQAAVQNIGPPGPAVSGCSLVSVGLSWLDCLCEASRD